MNFDLASLDTRTRSNQGFDLEIFNPRTMDGTGFMITIYGEDSDAYQQALIDETQRKIARNAGTVGQKSRREVVANSLDESDENEILRLAACTKGWFTKDKTPVLLEGKPFPFSSANATLLYQNYPLIRKQVSNAIGNRSNFMQTSEPSSSPTPSENSN